MDDARLVRRPEAAREAPPQDLDGVVVERPASESIGEGFAGDVLHGEVGQAELAIDGEDVVAHDRAVMHGVQRGRLLAEQGERQGVLRELRSHDLDGNRIAGLDHVPAENLAHPADSDRRIDFVEIVEPRPGTGAATAADVQDRAIVVHQAPPPAGRSGSSTVVGSPTAGRSGRAL